MKKKYLVLDKTNLMEGWYDSLEGLEGYMFINDVIKNRNDYYHNQEDRNGYEYRKWNEAYENGSGKYSWNDMKQINIRALSMDRVCMNHTDKIKQNYIIKKIRQNIPVNFIVWVNEIEQQEQVN
jgi:hypothetical protein